VRENAFMSILTETQKFKDWFGKSVVTEDGLPGSGPLLVYHGTDEQFENFDRVSFFTADKMDAATYGPIVKSAYLSIQNPWVAEEHEDNIWEIDETSVENLKKQGYDGAVGYFLPASNVEQFYYVAFFPEQIAKVDHDVMINDDLEEDLDDGPRM